QTETEATGAPQKHHYTLNQQVGSITIHIYEIMKCYYIVNAYCLDIAVIRRFLNALRKDLEHVC
ncbi:hypothetical protein, partial [Klebsiella pneumoniae]|uniref:hypothetical protein n=1 Tax=Klebsiella pneumoniae TaxID=573 RepID=UPI00209BED32